MLSGSFRFRTVTAFLAASMLLISGAAAHAGTPDRPAGWKPNDPMMKTLDREVAQVQRAACRGPEWNYLPTGLPGKPNDDIRCQAIATHAMHCDLLATTTVAYRQMIRSGQTTLSQLQSSIYHSRHAAVVESEALVLVATLPPTMHGDALVRTVYTQCMDAIPMKAQRAP